MPLNKQFFHVSRQGELPPELIMIRDYLDEALPATSTPEDHDLHSAFKNYFPDGISSHGRGYLGEPLAYKYDNGRPFIPTIYTIEIIFELVRKLKYPALPSRYTSLYVWETLDEAKVFKSKYGSTGNPIYVVRGANPFRVDMNLLSLGRNYLEALANAEKYWFGGQSKNPSWEVILSYPVSLIERVE